MGTVAAGLPLEVTEGAQETVTVPHDMVRRGNNYVLRVKGDSMIDEQIRDGDYIIVNSRQTADNGEMVVALVSDGSIGGSATVKKFYREKDGQVRLQPANPTMEPMYFPRSRCRSRGSWSASSVSTDPVPARARRPLVRARARRLVGWPAPRCGPTHPPQERRR
jgi:repressor LexA